MINTRFLTSPDDIFPLYQFPTEIIFTCIIRLGLCYGKYALSTPVLRLTPDYRLSANYIETIDSDRRELFVTIGS